MIGKFITKHSFGIMISASMSAIMLSVNVFIMEGFTIDAFRTLGILYFPIFFIAFIISTYIVSPVVKPIIKRITNQDTKMTVRVLLTTLLMVTGMSSLMSLVVTLINGPYETGYLTTWLSNLSRNYPTAFLVQFLAVGPVVRFVHETLLAPPATQEASDTLK